jgi:glucokinase-like ROK family protein
VKTIPEICLPWKGKLLVSCQASEGDAFRDADCMARFARAAVEGGAAGIRAAGALDIRAIRAAVAVPIIGIEKRPAADGRILITPTVEAARELAAAGAAVVALDCTSRGQRSGALDRLRRIRRELKVPVLADIATIEEARAAEEAGADFVLSTLRGYTDETAQRRDFDPEFIAELTGAVKVPVIAEGRIWTPEEARAAIAAGAFAVIVGTAITRPREITRRFAAVIESEVRRLAARRYFIGIDLGGTNIKSGLVSQTGQLISHAVDPTPAREGREAMVGQLKRVTEAQLTEARRLVITPAAIGVAIAGWPDPATGEVVYGTGNLPGWTGTRLGAELRQAFDLPVAVENDANAMAVGERQFGAARGVDDFVCVTLGTGVGCGIYLGGRLRRGVYGLAGALGHLQIVRDGLPCTCGKKGCLEVYANAAALIGYAGDPRFASAEEVIAAANSGDAQARQAVRMLARHLAAGCAAVVALLDPSLLLLAGGLTQNNPLLLSGLREELEGRLLARERRRLRVEFSTQRYLGGLSGAAAVALERSDQDD